MKSIITTLFCSLLSVSIYADDSITDLLNYMKANPSIGKSLAKPEAPLITDESIKFIDMCREVLSSKVQVAERNDIYIMELATLYIKNLRGQLERAFGDSLKHHLIRNNSYLKTLQLNSSNDDKFEEVYMQIASSVDNKHKKRESMLAKNPRSPESIVYVMNRVCATVDLYALSEGYDAESLIIAKQMNLDYLSTYLKDLNEGL